MPNTFSDRLKHAWNAFMNRDPPDISYAVAGSSCRPDRPRMARGADRSIVMPIYNRIAMDCASFKIEHVKIDENGKYLETCRTGLNTCLTLSANKDQTARSFIQDLVLSMFDEGCVAAVPIDTSFNPTVSGSYDILSMRVAKITEWFPDHVRVRVYNDRTGLTEDKILPKSMCAIVENPLYSVMNGSSSIAKRLIDAFNRSDTIDEQNASGKIDMLVQLPYAIKSPTRKEMADERRKDIEMQLAGSKYGIAYIDGTEKVIQLNRSVENNLNSRVEFLTKMFYSQLGITEEIMNGTADGAVMQNYYTRTVEPIISAITDEYRRKFLTKTARTQGQSILFFRDPFKLAPIDSVADMADKFTRNEILSSNEFRQIVGIKPVNDERADELRNKNLNEPDGAEYASTGEEYEEPEW